MKPYFVYIIKAVRTSKANHGETVYYTGFTDNPHGRLIEHRHKFKSNYMKTFRIIPLKIVYLEQIFGYFKALKREKEIKKLSLDKKLEMIKSYE